MDTYDPTAFELTGKKGGLFARTDEHLQQKYLHKEVSDLFFNDQYALLELQQGFERAQEHLSINLSESLEKINKEIQTLDESG